VDLKGKRRDDGRRKGHMWLSFSEGRAKNALLLVVSDDLGCPPAFSADGVLTYGCCRDAFKEQKEARRRQRETKRFGHVLRDSSPLLSLSLSCLLFFPFHPNAVVSL
jgi:hypothetical protein